MTRRLYPIEALTLLADAWNTDPDSYATGLIDAVVAPMSIDEARRDVDHFIDGLDDKIDPDSIEIIADRLDDSDMEAVRVIIKTEV